MGNAFAKRDSRNVEKFQVDLGADYLRFNRCPKPISSYYMPQILDSLGSLPNGAVIKIPTPSAA
jgi:hypothetical protein